MKTIRTIVLTGAMLLSATAFAQQYGPQDEGRRFNDGSKVVCKNVEVQRSSKDSNRILGTATGGPVPKHRGAHPGGGSPSAVVCRHRTPTG